MADGELSKRPDEVLSPYHGERGQQRRQKLRMLDHEAGSSTAAHGTANIGARLVQSVMVV